MGLTASFPAISVIDGNSYKQTVNQLPVAWQGETIAISTPLNGTISDTSPHILGPFNPQLAREIWLTLNATVAASGTAQLLRSIDNGVTQVGLTAGGIATAKYSFSGVTGPIVNEIVAIETEFAATYYLAITLSAGTVVCRVAQ
jgi:hypothetical protein